MKLSYLGYVWVWGMVVVNAGLSLVIEYPFLRALRIFFAVSAAVDSGYFLVHNSLSFPYLYWYSQIALLILQSFIAAALVGLLCPRLPRPIKRIIPAVIATATIVNGKPGTVWGVEYPTHHMLVYEILCLGFLLVALCFALIFSRVKRYETVALGFGMLLAAQSAAAVHRLFVGISPMIWNLCWLAGIAFIVHAVFTYEPDISLLKISPEGQENK